MAKQLYLLCNVMAFVAAGILFLLAALTFFDVIGRRFFDSPVTGTIEIVELGTAIAAFFAMPRAFITDSHVAAQFIDRLSRGKVGVVIALIRGVLMVITVGLMAYAISLNAFELMHSDRVTIELELPLYPFNTIIAVAAWVSTAAALAWLIRKLVPDRTS
ncbi:MAG: TRAP transporter small permease subunit [Proteobacteria bacterium]|nr:TRAP transporter small permease subunit [Pseudomonadota bacterium]